MVLNIKNKILASLGVSVIVTILIALVMFILPFTQGEGGVPLDSRAAATVVLDQKEQVPALPVRLIIPAIDVDAKVQFVGLDEDGSGAMAVPSNFTDVGWYQGGVRPGMSGSAVITGHLNGKKVPKAVFFNLDKLQVGDRVVIMSEELTQDIFTVVKVETYAYDAPTADVFTSADGKSRLNLITCGGEWLPKERVYNKRTVVFTELLTDVE